MSEIRMRLAVEHRPQCPAEEGLLERPWVLTSAVITDEETQEPMIVAACNDGLCGARAYLAVADLEATVAGQLRAEGAAVETSSSSKRKASTKA